MMKMGWKAVAMWLKSEAFRSRKASVGFSQLSAFVPFSGVALTLAQRTHTSHHDLTCPPKSEFSGFDDTVSSAPAE